MARPFKLLDTFPFSREVKNAVGADRARKPLGIAGKCGTTDSTCACLAAGQTEALGFGVGNDGMLGGRVQANQYEGAHRLTSGDTRGG